MSVQLSDFRYYIGDVNLEYGGTFFDLSSWSHGYVPALRVTDLDSGCGFTGAVAVERLTICLDCADLDDIQSAIDSCDMRQRIKGQSRSDSEKMDPNVVKAMIDSDPSVGTKLEIAYCFMSYGLYDPVSDMSGPHRWVIQCDSDVDYAPMEFDGWKASVRLSEDQDLFTYLLDNGYLSEFE